MALTSAVIFSLAHAGRSHLGLLTLVLDGVGFAGAFLLLRSLWLPVIWHLAKNVTVWLTYGSGTVELTRSVFGIEYLNPSWFVGSADALGVGDLLGSALAVAFVLWYASRGERGRAPGGGRLVARE